MAKVLGIDCGATNLRMGLVDEEGNLSEIKKMPSPLKSNPQSFAEIVSSQFQDIDVLAIGIGVPGPLDLEKGLILPSSNLGNKKPIDLVSPVASLFKKKVFLDRDTIAALLGEAWKGAAKDSQNVVMLTLGTGVGGAIMVNGEIDRGESGKAGEIGHMYIKSAEGRVMSDPPRCGLGHEGCLEAWINSTNDLEELGTYLGYGLANIVDIFNPEKIIIGGGKVNLGNFLPKAIEIMGRNSIKSAVDEVEVLYGTLKEWAGVIGGARLAYEKLAFDQK